MFTCDILTIFPRVIESYIGESILKRGCESGAMQVRAHNFRDFARDKHRKVDDSPYGGGPGMVLKVEPIYYCLEHLGLACGGKKVCRNARTKVIIMDPAGKLFTQRTAERFSKLDRLVIVCGRYEGFDERVYKFADEKISVGEYVLAGGELPALTVLEAVARLIHGVIGNPKSLQEETYSGTPNTSRIHIHSGAEARSKQNADKRAQYVEYPQYTRPADFFGFKTPRVLLGGDHKEIQSWRNKKVKMKYN